MTRVVNCILMIRMRTKNRNILSVFVAFAVLFVLGGCMERYEEISLPTEYISLEFRKVVTAVSVWLRSMPTISPALVQWPVANR